MSGWDKEKPVKTEAIEGELDIRAFCCPHGYSCENCKKQKGCQTWSAKLELAEIRRRE
jgi:hypothetical protein